MNDAKNATRITAADAASRHGRNVTTIYRRAFRFGVEKGADGRFNASELDAAMLAGADVAARPESPEAACALADSQDLRLLRECQILENRLVCENALVVDSETTRDACRRAATIWTGAISGMADSIRQKAKIERDMVPDDLADLRHCCRVESNLPDLVNRGRRAVEGALADALGTIDKAALAGGAIGIADVADLLGRPVSNPDTLLESLHAARGKLEGVEGDRRTLLRVRKIDAEIGLLTVKLKHATGTLYPVADHDSQLAAIATAGRQWIQIWFKSTAAAHADIGILQELRTQAFHAVNHAATLEKILPE